jgi:hypothetical protein
MLKANVGLSRKITRDYNSTGYSVNIEGEINAPLDDPQAVVARVHELFHLAEEALAVEIDRDQSEDAIGRRDKESVQRQPVEPTAPTRPTNPVSTPTPQKPTNGTPRSSNNDAATPKQVQFIENLAKRQKLSFTQLGTVIQRVVGQSKSLQQITKKEAGSVIDALNSGNGQQ